MTLRFRVLPLTVLLFYAFYIYAAYATYHDDNPPPQLILSHPDPAPKSPPHTMAHPGTVHKYSKRLIAFEHASPHSSPSSSPQNTLLWIGGLGDGLLTVSYPSTIAASLPPTWTLSEVLLSSSYKGWATGSLARDARELGDAVAYFRKIRPGGRVVLMGHSTGCQDIMEYVIGKGAEGREVVDGAILQGGVSDREGWWDMMSEPEQRAALEGTIAEAKKWIEEGRGKDVMPREGSVVAGYFVEYLGSAATAYRVYSLLAKGGDDDYFSTDLEDSVLKGSFGKFPAKTPLCLLLGSEDPYVPEAVDKAGLLARWTKFTREGGGVVDDVNGGVVEGATHNLSDDSEEVRQDLVKRVVGFLDGLEKGNAGGAESRL